MAVETATSLIKLDDARRFLSEVRAVDEVKTLRDKAEAMRVYAKQARLGLEAQNYAAEIKLRAERRAGELLAEMPKNEGAKGNPNGRGAPIVLSDDTTAQPPTLPELGITRDQSSNWQRIAAMPETAFAAAIETAKSDGNELTTAGMLRELSPETVKSTGRHKPKVNHAGDRYVPQGMDACQTPSYGLEPLYPYLHGLRAHWTFWEPACGEGLIVEALRQQGFRHLVTNDLLNGQNYFDYSPDAWDCMVTNPPYSIKYDWLERAYRLGKPFALLLPVETLGTKTAQELFRAYGVEIILMDQRVDFKMPDKGWGTPGDRSQAQFPTAWFTSGLCIGQQLTFTSIADAKRQFIAALDGLS